MQHPDVGLDHPIAIEILSLRDALAQLQHTSQQAAAQVQKYAFEALSANNKARQLAAENNTLQAELDVLRAPPPVASPSPAEAELTLALRRANARLEESQVQLLEANTSVAHVHAERERTAGEVTAAYQLLEAARAQEVELRAKLAERDAQKDTYELALSEYAALVRGLGKREGEATAPGISKEPAVTTGTEQIKELTVELARARADLESIQAQLDVERHTSEAERVQLAEVKTDLGRRLADDKSAAALVERYMKFSQHHTEVLQRALTDQSARHAATITSLSQRAEHLEQTLANESARHGRLQAALESLVEDLARESAGRRREIRVRLAIAGRTAKIEEDLRRWERRVREHSKPHELPGESVGLVIGQSDFDQLQTIVDLLGAPLVFRDAANSGSEDDSLSGPLSCILAAEIAVEGLSAELERETARRIELERERAQLPVAPLLEKPRVPDSDRKRTPYDTSVITSSASISITSLQSTFGFSLTESATSSSWNESSLIKSTIDIEEANPAVADSEPPAEAPVGLALDTPVAAIAPVVPPSSATSGVPHCPAVQAITTVPVAPITPVAPVTPVNPRVLSRPIDAVAPDDPPTPSPTQPLTSTVPFPLELPSPAEPEEAAEAQSQINSEAQELLQRLPTALQRYTAFQNTFRDCHLSLSALRTELRQRPRTHILTAVERLYDFNEDARVEIEIRIADEARRANGFEAMLHLSPSNVSDVVSEFRAFVDGSANDVHKALETAKRKRDELEHDIAAIKLSMHDPSADEEEKPAVNPPPSPMWARRSFLGPSYLSDSAGPPSPAPGVGFPLLRRVASGTLRHSRGSSLSGNELTDQTNKDPFASLGLKIPMPSPHSLSGPGTPLASPMKPSHQTGPTLVLERTRTKSLYRVGLGQSRSGLDLPIRSMTVTPTSKLGEDSDDGVE